MKTIFIALIFMAFLTGCISVNDKVTEIGNVSIEINKSFNKTDLITFKVSNSLNKSIYLYSKNHNSCLGKPYYDVIKIDNGNELVVDFYNTISCRDAISYNGPRLIEADTHIIVTLGESWEDNIVEYKNLTSGKYKIVADVYLINNTKIDSIESNIFEIR